MIKLYKVTKTDERMLADYLVPGVTAEQVKVTSVTSRYEDFNGVKKGHTFTVKVDTAERGAFGIFKDLNAATLKDTQDVPFEFDIASLSWNVANGVLRVAIPRKAEFAGKAVLVANKDDIFGEIPADAGVNAAE